MARENYEERTKQLDQSISLLEKKFGHRRNVSTYVIIAVVAPALVFAILFSVQPRFTQSETKKGTKDRDRKKLAQWTLALTCIVYGIMLIVYCYQNSPRRGGFGSD